MAKVEAETAKELTAGEHVSNLLSSEGWKTIKAKLDQRILDLQNINNLDMEKPETLSIQLAARKMAADFIFAWLKDDVYGFVEQQRANADALRDTPADSYIEEHGE